MARYSATVGELVQAIEDGGEGPALVYLPGVDGTGRLLLGTAESLKRSFRLVRLRYVSGTLPSVEGGYREMATDICRVLDEHGIERPLLLAESFGVALAVRTALDHPQRVRAMGLVNGFVHFPVRWRIALTNLLLPLVPGALFRIGRHVAVPLGMIHPRRDPELVRTMLDSVGDYFDATFLRRLEMIRHLDLREELGRVRCPVSLFASSADRVVASVRSSREMAGRLPDSRLEILENAGHVILPFPDEPWTERMLALAGR